MASYQLDAPATAALFDETAYLCANPDVLAAVEAGHAASGRAHFDAYGKMENRRLRFTHLLDVPKKVKLARIVTTLRSDMPMLETGHSFDFLSDELRTQFNIVDTSNISSNQYDPDVLSLIESMPDGLILDCGAGRRNVYHDNVVNFEIANYDTTDVRGVGEILPFKDNSFDAVLSLAVLEHVKDPFACAREIIRVLKPHGQLICCVPFLQPMHGYPHHYYNMSEQGIRNLFDKNIEIFKHIVPESATPIWSLSWILNSWAAGLETKARDEFVNLKVADLMKHPGSYRNKPFVKGLTDSKNFELASATMIFGRKII